MEDFKGIAHRKLETNPVPTCMAEMCCFRPVWFGADLPVFEWLLGKTSGIHKTHLHAALRLKVVLNMWYDLQKVE